MKQFVKEFTCTSVTTGFTAKGSIVVTPPSADPKSVWTIYIEGDGVSPLQWPIFNLSEDEFTRWLDDAVQNLNKFLSDHADSQRPLFRPDIFLAELGYVIEEENIENHG